MSSAAARSSLLVAVATLASACERTAPPTYAVRDSAGVRIVESSAPSWADGEGWTVASEPSLSIGALDGPAEISFDGIRSVRRFADGMLVVADAGSGEVRLFDGAGRFVRAFGASGDGPGEFRLMQSVGVARDSVWIYDVQLNRLTVVDPATGGSRATQLEARGLRLGAAGALADASLVFAADLFGTVGAGALSAGMRRANAAYVRIAPTGETLDTILVAEGSESFVRIGDDFIEVIRPPFWRTVSHALRGERLLYGHQTSYEIRSYDLAGTLLEVDRRSGVDLSFDESAYLEAVEARVALAPEAGQASLRRSYEEMPRPSSRPAFREFIVDALDHLWVQDFSIDGSATTWAVFSPEGFWMGDVVLPDGFEPTQILGDEMIGVWRDELDVEHVRAYALTRD
jgi:hypothetical protein